MPDDGEGRVTASRRTPAELGRTVPSDDEGSGAGEVLRVTHVQEITEDAEPGDITPVIAISKRLSPTATWVSQAITTVTEDNERRL